MPPAKSTWILAGRRRRARRWSRSTRSSCPRARSWCAGRRGRRTRGPRRRSGAAPPWRNMRSSPGDGTCRYVAMPSLLQLAAWSGRPPAISANGGACGADRLELLGAQLGRHEAEDADAPGPVAQQLAGLARAARSPPAAHQAEREDGRAPASATAAANAARSLTRGHRALHDGIARAEAAGERRALRQGRCHAAAMRHCWRRLPDRGRWSRRR